MKKTLAIAAVAAVLTVAAGAARADRLSWSVGVNVAPGVTTVIGNGGRGYGRYAAPVYAPPAVIYAPPVAYGPPAGYGVRNGYYDAPRVGYYGPPAGYAPTAAYVPVPVYAAPVPVYGPPRGYGWGRGGGHHWHQRDHDVAPVVYAPAPGHGPGYGGGYGAGYGVVAPPMQRGWR